MNSKFLIGCVISFVLIFSTTIAYKSYLDNQEISKEQYTKLLECDIKYPSFGKLIYHSARDDNQISQKEYKELMEIYRKISMNDHINLFLQEKAHDADEVQ